MRVVSAKIPVLLTILVVVALVAVWILGLKSEADWTKKADGLAIWAGGAGVAASLWVLYGVVCLCVPGESLGEMKSTPAETAADTVRRNRNCIDPMHHQHLCYVEATALRMVRPEEYGESSVPTDIASLTDNPHFECEYCGRVANDGENLCTPHRMRLEEPQAEDA